MKPSEGRSRVVIEDVQPRVGCGRFPVKRIVNNTLRITAVIYADGHDAVAGRLLYKHENERAWRSTPMQHICNDVWEADFSVTQVGRYSYSIEAWIDTFATWRHDWTKRVEADQELDIPLLTGISLIQEAASRARKSESNRLRKYAAELSQYVGAIRQRGNPSEAQVSKVENAEDHHQIADEAPFTTLVKRNLVMDKNMLDLAAQYPDLRHATRSHEELEVVVDRDKAQFSTWYELFPRSTSPISGQHGTFSDCESLLPSIAAMGFDVVYLPPIHPIGLSFRKGKNNSVHADPADVGSPWAIGSRDGGHKEILAELGLIDDFDHFVAKAKALNMEVALDIAFQCSPDHPWVVDHPEWFRKRVDGSIQYAENPPKKYQDIYPLDFETPHWRKLWDELKSVFVHWIGHGVSIFRVDNPHTKAFPFWQWLITEIKKTYPDVLFLAEAFTRPHVMYGLAKVGFSQSYTYFTWKTTKAEITEYFRELTRSDLREYFRPNLWPNTPDILHGCLQQGGRPAFIVRIILAATLAANYGIYSPAYELCENVAVREGSEEYLDSEKYQIRHWNRESAQSLAPLITKLNCIRRKHAALQDDTRLHFHQIGNDQLICYSKSDPQHKDIVLVVANLDYGHTQAGWISLDLNELGLVEEQEFTVHDLLTGEEYRWRGSHNYILLAMETRVAHVFCIQQHATQSY